MISAQEEKGWESQRPSVYYRQYTVHPFLLLSPYAVGGDGYRMTHAGSTASDYSDIKTERDNILLVPYENLICSIGVDTWKGYFVSAAHNSCLFQIPNRLQVMLS